MLSPSLPAWPRSRGILVNDVHSQLNPTRVSKIAYPQSMQGLQDLMLQARRDGKKISICGARHAGGGQQFASEAILVDTKQLNRVLHFDQAEGLLEVQSGIRWPELLSYLERAQEGSRRPWGIAQKQTGGDQLTIGGALAANVHGQGLTMKPFISNVEAFTLIDSNGHAHKVSRNSNPELFRCVIGGYGLFGIIHSVTLRLVPRLKVERIVEIMEIEDLIPKVEKCIAEGYPYGDFQVNIDNHSDSFLRNGVFSGYRLKEPETPIPRPSGRLKDQAWFDFVYGAHVNKSETFERYVEYYQASSGLTNWSDVWQSGPYLQNYHQLIDRKMQAPHKGTEVLTELYVPRERLCSFLSDVRADFLKNNVNLIYSTVRFFARDDESLLAWAKDSYACVIFNLHTVHTHEGIEHSASAFRRLIDLAIKYGGSYYLTYHKFASRSQVSACYPQFSQVLSLKRDLDPSELIESDWYRHYKQLFS